jgi:glyoxylase-like metal-dependent hydrolase (beta-lactamase superfamily II)
MVMMSRALLILFGLLSSLAAHAFDTVRVSDKIYALVGDLGQRSPQNLGHNMTSGFIVAEEGVIVIDTGGSSANAVAIHAAIRRITDKKVIYAINTGGQDHRWFGNNYFRKLGTKIVATESAGKDMRARGAEQVERIKPLLGEKFSGTELVYPDITFTQRMTLPVKSILIELIYTGGAHTPGELLVWLPQHSIVFAGDTVFAERMLGVLPDSAGRWIKSLEYLRDTLKPRIVVPGHGKVTDMKQSLRDSYDYLVFLRDAVKKRFADGAFDPVEASQNLDQSRFSYLKNYADLGLRSRNALAVAEEVFKSAQK